MCPSSFSSKAAKRGLTNTEGRGGETRGRMTPMSIWNQVRGHFSWIHYSKTLMRVLRHLMSLYQYNSCLRLLLFSSSNFSFFTLWLVQTKLQVFKDLRTRVPWGEKCKIFRLSQSTFRSKVWPAWTSNLNNFLKVNQTKSNCRSRKSTFLPLYISAFS